MRLHERHYIKIKRLCEKDRPALISYISEEPEYNLFVAGDVEAYSLDSEVLDVWVFLEGKEIDSLLMRFKEYYISYSKNENFRYAPVLRKLHAENAMNISAKKSVIERLFNSGKGRSDFEITETYLSRLDDLTLEIDTSEVQKAAIDDIDEITRFYCDINEFGTRYHYERSLSRSKDYIKTGTGRFFYIKIDGEIAAVAASSAENLTSAMIVGVATKEKFRNKGLATKVVAALCKDLLRDGKKLICLFYFNPNAGRIYKRIGFKDVGEWCMGKRYES